MTTNERIHREGDGSVAAAARPQLVFDIGGVLATNISPLFWNLVANEAKRPVEQIYRPYKEEISGKLWTGEVTEAAFWEWLVQHAEGLSMDQGKAFLEESLVPLPALREVERWSMAADIHILSNHVETWIAPLISDVRPHLASVTISSLAGYRKPHREAFDIVAAKLRQNAPILFVDDQQRNLEAAETAGWATLLADPNGHWIGEVDAWLDAAARTVIADE
ncbi:HAD-IA family hydrolase [Paenibacillus soyae]|uniref:HAD-IA family hydrolase n=1 Tax=Paenibacillus soyae TaxID=2969249 RepID=A0A9X2S952_9BACL|nr:HAD-IA family hydrolase [Paenibacillus soyae]MCR2805099.1 HAD-IA family hydrolase [Paenibacillus soyae]